MKMKWLWLTLLVVIFDQITKYMASDLLLLHQPVHVFPSLNMTLAHNTGAAFSFLGDAGGWQRWFFVSLSLIVSVFLIFWIRSLPITARWLSCALALVLGGAIGNLIDRFINGYVVDFIDFYYHSWHFATFNIADIAISIGAIMLLIDAFWLKTESD